MDPARGAKRRSQRRHCSLPIELRRDGSSCPLRSTAMYLSPGGCYANLTPTLAVGTVMDLVLWASDTKLAFRGKVRSADRVGNGIDFTGMTDEQRTRLQRYLDEIKAPAEFSAPAAFTTFSVMVSSPMVSSPHTSLVLYDDDGNEHPAYIVQHHMITKSVDGYGFFPATLECRLADGVLLHYVDENTFKDPLTEHFLRRTD